MGPKRLLFFLAGITLLFTILYPVFAARKGVEYRDTLLRYASEEGSRIYSGRVDGAEVTFVVDPSGVVTCQWGGKHYGPYTVREDSTVEAGGDSLADLFTGVEIREGDRVFFRGGWNETFSILEDENGAMVDERSDAAPDAKAILWLWADPPLTHRGDETFYWIGLGSSLLCAVLIFFADDLFRRSLSWRIKDPEWAEPSEFELGKRVISWVGLTAVALICYLAGLFYFA